MFITRKAIQKFIRAPRHNFQLFKELSEPEIDRLMGDYGHPKNWASFDGLHQKVCYLIGYTQKRFAFFLDCVTGDTLIETDKGPQQIKTLSEQKKPIKVLSLTDNGLNFVEASCPFSKGIDSIYQVKFKSGRDMKVAAKHLFMTARGWIFCDELQIGERLPIFSPNREKSISELSLSKCVASEPHLMNTAPNCPENHYLGHHLCGEQLLLEKGTFPIFLPLLDENEGHTLTYEKKGDLVYEQANNHHSPCIIPLSKNHCVHHNSPFLYYKECSQIEYDLAQFDDCTCISEIIHQDVRLAPQIPLNGAFQLNEHVLWAFQNSIEFDTVVSVEYLRQDVKYDLHVPKWNNYISNGLCHHNTGMGKTFLSIMLMTRFHQEKLIKHALVLVPNNINKDEWEDELQKHSPNSKYVILSSSTKERIKQLEDNDDALFFVDTYNGFMRLVTVNIKNKMVIDRSMLKACTRFFQAIVLDESTFTKNHQTLFFRICRQLSKNAKSVFLLTGTPFGDDPSDLWPQMYLVDKGESIGSTLGMFRAAMFIEEQTRWAVEYKFDKTKFKLLNRLLANNSIRYKADKKDLPKVRSLIKRVNLPTDTATYYEEAKKAMRRAHGNMQEMENILIRMRQISSGFVGFSDDETGAKAKYEFPTNPKLEMLRALLEEIGPKHKVIIFHEFHFSGNKICTTLDEIKIPYVYVGGARKNDTREALKRFKTDPKCRIFVLSNAAGAFGINVQVAQYGIYYERPISKIINRQTIRRIERQHSEHDMVFIYDILCKGTYDEAILRSHIHGNNLFRAIIDADKKELKK